MPGWQQSLVDAWYRGAWWLWLLRPLELLFRLLSALRRWCFRRGLLKSYRAPVPVVVVGNITLGGTGKTPVVIALVEALQAKGIRPGVVSRGYGAIATAFPHRVTEQSQAVDCGDEALLIQRRTGCPCVVGPHRGAAVDTLLTHYQVDLVLSDDGLQHYALQRDLEIVIVDAERGLGNGFCLPAGPLREPPSRLDEVQFVLYRGSDDPVCGVAYESERLVNLATAETARLGAGEPGPAVHAVAGIGQPGQFFSTLEAAGLAIEAHVFPDHHNYTAEDLRDLDDKPVIMTEKDAVKCRELVRANAWYLKISARLPRSVPEAVAGLVQRA